MRIKIGIIIIIVIIVSIGGILLISNRKKTKLDEFENVYIVYNYDEKNIFEKMPEEETKTIKDILNNNALYSDNLSCGFSKDIALQFGEDYLISIARDTCPIFKEEKTGKYFKVSKKEREIIEEILKKYGVTFPCL